MSRLSHKLRVCPKKRLRSCRLLRYFLASAVRNYPSCSTCCVYSNPIVNEPMWTWLGGWCGVTLLGYYQIHHVSKLPAYPAERAYSSCRNTFRPEHFIVQQVCILKIKLHKNLIRLQQYGHENKFLFFLGSCIPPSLHYHRNRGRQGNGIKHLKYQNPDTPPWEMNIYLYRRSFPSGLFI